MKVTKTGKTVKLIAQQKKKSKSWFKLSFLNKLILLHNRYNLPSKHLSSASLSTDTERVQGRFAETICFWSKTFSREFAFRSRRLRRRSRRLWRPEGRSNRTRCRRGRRTRLRCSKRRSGSGSRCGPSKSRGRGCRTDCWTVFPLAGELHRDRRRLLVGSIQLSVES